MNKKTQGTNKCPRLYVFKSNKHIYAQLINDTNRTILVSSSSISSNIKKHYISSTTCDIARLVGQDIAIQSRKKGIRKIVFDRGQKLYHGQVQALADSARKAGMIF